jgi:hypothetical protein
MGYPNKKSAFGITKSGWNGIPMEGLLKKCLFTMEENLNKAWTWFLGGIL